MTQPIANNDIHRVFSSFLARCEDGALKHHALKRIPHDELYLCENTYCIHHTRVCYIPNFYIFNFSSSSQPESRASKDESNKILGLIAMIFGVAAFVTASYFYRAAKNELKESSDILTYAQSNTKTGQPNIPCALLKNKITLVAQNQKEIDQRIVATTRHWLIIGATAFLGGLALYVGTALVAMPLLAVAGSVALIALIPFSIYAIIFYAESQSKNERNYEQMTPALQDLRRMVDSNNIPYPLWIRQLPPPTYAESIRHPSTSNHNGPPPAYEESFRRPLYCCPQFVVLPSAPPA